MNHTGLLPSLCNQICNMPVEREEAKLEPEMQT